MEPMLATAGMPTGGLASWAVEPKFDGWRARVLIKDGAIRVRTRTGRVITETVPELGCLAGHPTTVLLDGELIAGAGRLEDFAGLSGRLAGRRRTTDPVVFVAFDLLVNGEPIIDQPYTERRRSLEALDLPGLLVAPSYLGEDAPALLAACEDTGMEGVILKGLDSPYLPGKRSDAWRKVKCAAWAEHGRTRFARNA